MDAEVKMPASYNGASVRVKLKVKEWLGVKLISLVTVARQIVAH
jgi:hypothetical protein